MKAALFALRLSELLGAAFHYPNLYTRCDAYLPVTFSYAF